MRPQAIIFDVDGTLADTERWGHLPACNEAFRVLGLPLQWEWAEFKELMVTIQGNANRLRHALTRLGTYAPADIEAYIEAFVPIKQELYVNKYLPLINLREGIADFISEIKAAGIPLAIVSTSYEAQINELLKTKLPDVQAAFKPVLGKGSGQKTGSEGVLYGKCLSILGAEPTCCLVIEDSAAGLRAALQAGIPTVVFYNDYTANEDFTGAVLVAPSVTQIDTRQLIDGTIFSKPVTT